MEWNCANCSEKECYQGRDCADFTEKIRKIYKEKDIARIHKVSSLIEARHYMQKCRLQELMIFCHEMEYKKLGVAFCIGLAEEARLLVDLLKTRFSVSSVCCKCSAIMKEDMGIENIIKKRSEAICNPAGQAQALGDNDTELNIIVGLCVGHDIIFSRYSKAPVTTLIVKDRVLAHNPAGALYSQYWRKKIFKDL